MTTGAAPAATGRLGFRPWRDEDAPHLVEMFSDPEVMQFSVTGPRSREATLRWQSDMRGRYEGTALGFRAVLLRDCGEYVGQLGLLLQEVEGEAHTEIAYWLRRRYWGRGLATEAARAFRDFGFRDIGARRLISLIHPRNLPSQSVAARNGMRMEREVTWRGIRVRMFCVTRAAWAGADGLDPSRVDIEEER